MTKTRIRLAALPLLALLVGLLGAWAVGGSAWSVLGGFVASALVILASWQRAFANVQNALQSDAAVALAHETTARHDAELAETLYAQNVGNAESAESGQSGQPSAADSKPQKPKRLAFFARGFRSGAGLFVAPFRLGAYVVLIVIFLALLRHNVFGVFSFLFGSFLALGALLVCLLIESKTRD
ncbi:MAG: hypothetical protein K2F85_07305 [Helicobacter sp.]|nr:hypothetical protein [Helicobacter sp.]